MSTETLVSMFLATARARGDAPALRSKVGGAWRVSSWAEWEQRSRTVAARLVGAGVEAGDRVAVFGPTCEAWVVIDLAILMAGAITVPVYPSLTGDQAAYILRDSRAKVLFAGDRALVRRIHEHDGEVVRGLSLTVLFDEISSDEAPSSALRHIDVRASAVRPGNLATIVYTSGTTGPPKGVMLTHGNLVADTEALSAVVSLGPDDEQLLFLPLAHIFGKMLVMMQYRAGFTTAFAESLVQALDNAVEVNPTFMGCVPRLYEKVYAGAHEKAAAAGGLRARIFAWATRPGPRGPLSRWLADALVLSKIRGRFGSRLRFAISGGAPLARELAEWFDAAGLLILEAYGLTETTGGTTLNAVDAHRFGTVGKVLPGLEVRIAEDGEILVRGPTIMRGYWNREDDTRAVLTEDGWFHTGDIGVLGEDGFLTITDRKKDILVTAGGKNIAPQNLENLLRQSAWISQAMVCGDRRPYLVALVTLNAETAARFARDRGLAADPESLAKSADVRAEVGREIDAINARLPSFETVKRFGILPGDFSIDGGELTPTLKVRRKVVAERHAAAIEALYASPLS